MRLINSDSQIEDASVYARDSGSANSNTVRFELGGFALVAAFSVMFVCVGFSIWAYIYAQGTRDLLDARSQAWTMSFDSLSSQMHDTKTQAWLAERRLMDMEAYAMLNGWKIPSDDQHGPTGNFQRMKPKEK